jgi:hypothetical protein
VSRPKTSLKRTGWSLPRPEKWDGVRAGWVMIALGVVWALVLLVGTIAETDTGTSKDGGQHSAAPEPEATTSSPDPTDSPGTTCEASQRVSIGVVPVSLDGAATSSRWKLMDNLDAVGQSLRCRITLEPEFVDSAHVSEGDVQCSDVSKWGREADAKVGIDADSEARPYDVTLYVVAGKRCTFDGVAGAAVPIDDAEHGNAGDAYVFGPPTPGVLEAVISKSLGTGSH